MLTPAEFRALAAQMQAALDEAARAGQEHVRDSARHLVTVDEAAALTGYAADTLRQYERRARRERKRARAEGRPPKPGLIPQLQTDPRWHEPMWHAADLALWMAGAYEHERHLKVRAPLRKAGRPVIPDSEYLPLARKIMRKARRNGVTVDVDTLQRLMREAGLTADWYRAKRLLLAAKGPPPGPPEPSRPDGLVTTAELARAYGVDSSAITQQRKRGHLTPVKYEGTVPLYDPAKIGHPGGTRRTPVDAPSQPGKGSP